MNCCQQNPVFPELKADRIPLSNISTNGYLITHPTPIFCESDIGKVIVVYDSVIIPWDTLYPDQYQGSAASLAALNALLPAEKVDGYIRNALDTTPNIFYRYSTDGAAGWYPLKVRQSKACYITRYISQTEVRVDYEYDELTSLIGSMGTDNFWPLQKLIYQSIDNNVSAYVPDGDYLVMFSDIYDSINDPRSKQRIRLFKEPGSICNLQGESTEKTRLYYEYETEYSYSVYGIGIVNQNPSDDCFYEGTVSNLQIIGPRYKHKLQELVINGYRPNSWGMSSIGQNIVMNMTGVVIDGEEFRCLSTGIDTFSDGVTIFSASALANLNVTNSVIKNCCLTGLGEFGKNKVLNATNTLIENIGLLPEDSYTGRVVGTGFYPHPENSFRFLNCTFKNIPRHFMGINVHAVLHTTVFYQELIDCNIIHCGHGSLDHIVSVAKIHNCLFLNSKGIAVANSCEISDCTFRYDPYLDNVSPAPTPELPVSSPYTAIFVAAHSFSEEDDFRVNINNCTFYGVTPFVHYTGVDASAFTFKFSDCIFDCQDYVIFSYWIQLSRNKLIVQDCLFKGITLGGIVIANGCNAQIIGNTFDSGSNNGMIYLEGANAKVELINNQFNQNNPITIDNASGITVSGFDNYFARWGEFKNSRASIGGVSQKLLGRRGYYPETITLPNSFTSGFLDEVKFNYDFYKITRETGLTTPLDIKHIAFDDNSADGLYYDGIALFAGTIKLMAIHDPSVDGDIIIKDNGGSLTNGNVFMPSGDYTMVPFEVIEFYYDSDTKFWNMLK